MIRITEPLIDITMKINLDLPQSQILEYLSKKDYKIEAYHLILDAKEEMLISAEWTFTATREGESQSEENLYLKVFEKEMKAFLNSI